ncbi:MAG: TonB-dependent receptor [Paracoccus sp. (in: a-proteobacteria)]|uniref:hypothetical protein n=1 Tax=Paracoccus sp. TaxID=267 RepID=UPI0039E70FFC
MSGKLNEAGAIRGRHVSIHDQANSFRDNIESRNDTLYGLLDYDLGETTTLTFGGVQVQSDATSLYGVKYPGFAVWDANVQYRLTDSTSLRLTVNNLFDRRYYESSRNSVNGMNSFYGEPRTVALTLKTSF